MTAGEGASVMALNHAAFPIVMIPGAREPGTLTRFFDTGAEARRVPPPASNTMSAAVINQRQREGGGAERERRPNKRPLYRRVQRWLGV